MRTHHIFAAIIGAALVNCLAYQEAAGNHISYTNGVMGEWSFDSAAGVFHGTGNGGWDDILTSSHGSITIDYGSTNWYMHIGGWSTDTPGMQHFVWFDGVDRSNILVYIWNWGRPWNEVLWPQNLPDPSQTLQGGSVMPVDTDLVAGMTHFAPYDTYNGHDFFSLIFGPKPGFQFTEPFTVWVGAGSFDPDAGAQITFRLPYYFSMTAEPVPEPITVLGVFGGLASLGAYVRRRLK